LRYVHGSSPSQREIQVVGNDFCKRMFLFTTEQNVDENGEPARMRGSSGDRKMELKGRTIYGGAGEGVALSTSQPISFYGGVDPNTGEVIEKGHELQGQSVKGKVLAFPSGKGSTVGSYTLYRMKKNGTAPAGIVNRECETVVAVGAIISEIPCVDQIDIAQIKTGDRVRIEKDTVTIL